MTFSVSSGIAQAFSSPNLVKAQSAPTLRAIPGGLSADPSAARAFIEQFFGDKGALLFASQHGKGARAKTFTAHEYQAAANWAAGQNDERNIYFSIAQPTSEAAEAALAGKKLKLAKGDVGEIAWLWADIDPPPNCDLADWHAQTLTRLESFEMPPSALIFSGAGIWPFWRLKEPFVVGGNEGRTSEFERFTKGLARALDADRQSVDAARIARLVGSVNWPDEKKIAKGRKPTLAKVRWSDEGRTYSLDDFARYVGDVAPARNSVRSIDLSNSSPIADMESIPALYDVQLRRLADERRSKGKRSEQVFAFACAMVRANSPDDVIGAILLDDRFGVSEHVLEQTDPRRAAERAIRNAHEAVEKEFDIRENGSVIAKSMRNIRLAVVKLGVSVRRNLLSGEIIGDGVEGVGPVFDDDFLNRVRREIEARCVFLPEKEMLADVVSDFAKENEYHPIRDYLDSMTWDGGSRLDTWLSSYLGSNDTPLVRAFGRKFMIAAVRRARTPGTKFDEMLVLEGAQGSFKSTALKVLAKQPDWFCDDAPLGAAPKELIEAVRGAWIVEVPELFAVKKADFDRIKQVLAKTHDKARMAYMRYEVTRPRDFVFAGTTNSDLYLTDPTGNRHFWPVRTGKIDIEALRRDVDHLWAEAAHYEALGEDLFLSDELRAMAAEAQSDRVAEDLWMLPLRDKLHDLFGKIRPHDVMAIIGKPIERQGSMDARRLTDVMKSLGWSRENSASVVSPLGVSFAASAMRTPAPSSRRSWLR